MVSGSGSPGGDVCNEGLVLKACLAWIWKARGDSRAFVAEGRCVDLNSDAMMNQVERSIIQRQGKKISKAKSVPNGNES